MLSPQKFIDTLLTNGIDFFAGVPDSLLKNVCAYITDHVACGSHVIAANEGGAVALAAGHYLATGNMGCVYMQNSGQGNAVNPLASLTDAEVYHIPLLLLIGWRGRPGVHDEPQHVKQGKITTGLLNTMGINYEVLSHEEPIALKQTLHALESLHRTGDAYALVVERDTFESYTLQHTLPNDYPLRRESAVRQVADAVSKYAVIVSTTGMISRELFEYRVSMGQGHGCDFLTVGSMGHASQIALGIALAQPNRRVFCFDGDGAVIMHMGGMAIVGARKPKNYVHVVFNNGAHDSVGGQPTVGHDIELTQVARAVGYSTVLKAETAEQLADIMCTTEVAEGPVFVEIRVARGNRKDLGRPTTTPVENKEALMNFLKNS